jgi:hypothetical protein
LAGAALGATASAAFADPAAEVSPGSVEPGGTVTITVTCEAAGGTSPESIEASSQGFEAGKVELHRVEGADPNGAGAAAYRGTARIPSGGSGPSDESGAGSSPDPAGASDAKNPGAVRGGGVNPAPGGSDTVAPDAVAPAPVAVDPSASDPVVPDPDPPVPDAVGPGTVGPDDLGPDTVPEPVGPDTVPEPVGPETVGPGTVGPDAVGPDAVGPEAVAPDKVGPEAGGASRWDVQGVCPAPPGGHGEQWSASYSVAGGSTATHGTDSGPGTGADNGIGPGSGTGDRPPTVQRGVEAGQGGVFTDSVPALAVGGVLIAGALGVAAHHLRRRHP